MKKGRKFLSILGITGALVCMMYRGVQADSGIVMDGSFYDWESISHVSIDAKDSFYNQIAIKMDEQYIYMHCVEQQPNLWNPFSYMNFQVTLEVQKVFCLLLVRRMAVSRRLLSATKMATVR